MDGALRRLLGLLRAAGHGPAPASVRDRCL